MKLIKPTIPMVVGLVVVMFGLTTRGQEAHDQLTFPNGPLETMLAKGPTRLHDAKVSRDETAPAPLFALKTVPTVAPAVTPTIPWSDGAKVETATECYPNGNIKVEREVILDSAANYVNHGKYTMYGLDGSVLKTGEFRDGKQHGKWIQHFTEDKGHIISAEQQKEFAGPFVSEATFVDGTLNGTWTIKDCSGQNIIEWSFSHGVRNGKWTWWHSNGQKWLEATCKNGALNGELLEWDRDGKLVAQFAYIDGRYLAKEVGWYALGHKHFEGEYLRVPTMPEPVYDWWTGSATAPDAAPTGEDQKHGVWTAWYRNGNKKTEGAYDHGVLIGKFTWWYENGQKQAEGEYLAGVDSGTWTTWHPNGLRESQITYVDGEPIGTWMRWDTEGKLAGMRDFDIEPSKKAPIDRANTGQRPSSTVRSRSQKAPMARTNTGQRPSSTVRSRSQKAPMARTNTSQQPSSTVRSR